MANTDVKKDAYSFTQAAQSIQAILDNVQALNRTDVNELIKLLEEIKNISMGDDDESIGQQLLNALDSMVKEDEVQTEINDSTYPPSSKAVQDALAEHRNATELDHANQSIQRKHIADEAIGNNQIAPNAITTDKISLKAITDDRIADATISKDRLVEPLQTILDEAINEEYLTNYISIVSKAKKYVLSDLHANRDIGYEIPGNMDEYFILKNDSSSDLSEIPWSDLYVWELSRPMLANKTYLCILRDFIDDDGHLQNGHIDIVCEMGSDVIDLKTAVKNWSGIWHIGNELDYTGLGQIRNTNIPNVKQGDFYLNQDTYGVYLALNDSGDWKYVGNLSGSVDTTLWAQIHSPNFTGVPTVPTPETTNNSIQIANTAFVRNAIEKYAGSGSSGSNGGSTNITVDSELSTTSVNPVQNKVITEVLKKINSGKTYVEFIYLNSQLPEPYLLDKNYDHSAIDLDLSAMFTVNGVNCGDLPVVTVETGAGSRRYICAKYNVLTNEINAFSSDSEIESNIEKNIWTFTLGWYEVSVSTEDDPDSPVPGTYYISDCHFDFSIPYRDEKWMLSEIIDNTESITVDTALSDTSENPVQNKAVKEALDNIKKSQITVSSTMNTSTTDPVEGGVIQTAIDSLGMQLERRIEDLEKNNKSYTHTTTPTQIGTWVDGTPIWRVSFPSKSMILSTYCKYKEDGYIVYIDTDHILQSQVKTLSEVTFFNPNNIIAYSEVPEYNIQPVQGDDTMAKIYFSYGTESVYEDLITHSNGYWYGWIEFATPESNLI